MRRIGTRPYPPAPPRRGSPRLKRLRRLGVRMAALTAIVGAPALAWQAGQLDPVIEAARHWSANLSSSLHLTIAELSVSGRRRTSQSAIQAALDIRRGAPIFGIDLGRAKERLEALPWIATAAIERKLPDAIHVQVVERTAVGRWRQRGRMFLVDRNGIVFAAGKAETYTHLPLLKGSGAPDNAAALVDMMASRPALAKRVAQAARRGDRRWDLVFESGLVVRLPENKPRLAWERLAHLEQKFGLLSRGLVAIDMRLPDRLVLRTPPGATPSAVAPGKNT